MACQRLHVATSLSQTTAMRMRPSTVATATTLMAAACVLSYPVAAVAATLAVTSAKTTVVAAAVVVAVAAVPGPTAGAAVAARRAAVAARRAAASDPGLLPQPILGCCRRQQEVALAPSLAGCQVQAALPLAVTGCQVQVSPTRTGSEAQVSLALADRELVESCWCGVVVTVDFLLATTADASVPLVCRWPR